MDVFRYKGHNAYCINKKLVIIKNNKGNKIKFYFKGGGFKNFKFDLSAHWHIRLPFFYWHKRGIELSE